MPHKEGSHRCAAALCCCAALQQLCAVAAVQLPQLARRFCCRRCCAGDNGEYTESEQTLNEWVGLDGRPATELGTLQLDEELELCQVCRAGVQTAVLNCVKLCTLLHLVCLQATTIHPL